MRTVRFQYVPIGVDFREPANGGMYTKLSDRTAKSADGWVDTFHPREEVEIEE